MQLLATTCWRGQILSLAGCFLFWLPIKNLKRCNLLGEPRQRKLSRTSCCFIWTLITYSIKIFNKINIIKLTVFHTPKNFVSPNKHKAKFSWKQLNIKRLCRFFRAPANYLVDWMISGQSNLFHVHRLLQRHIIVWSNIRVQIITRLVWVSHLRH